MSRSVLVVEDNSELQIYLAEYLSMDFDKVIKVTDGVEALEVYKEHLPGAIFTDINLPSVNGLELVEKIRAIDNNIPIVILSAHTQNDYFVKAIELNVVTYLIKPIQTDKLKEAIDKVLDVLDSQSTIELNNGYLWDTIQSRLLYEDKELNLSSYEKSLIECLYKNANSCVSYIDIHLYINQDSEYSKDSITSLVKRLRQKTKKEFIETCYLEGYKLVVNK